MKITGDNEVGRSSMSEGKHRRQLMQLSSGQSLYQKKLMSLPNSTTEGQTELD